MHKRIISSNRIQGKPKDVNALQFSFGADIPSSNNQQSDKNNPFKTAKGDVKTTVLGDGSKEVEYVSSTPNNSGISGLRSEF